MSRNYLIIQSSELDKINFSQILETSADTLRKSVDNTKTFIKWDGDTPPDCVSNLTGTEGPYTKDQIRTILNTDVWTSEEEI
jgi:hypothetical protein|tara:strand:+ start:1161 stop:1406 length:246 start_codon:yes stop_codon:yes gene_type:complete